MKVEHVLAFNTSLIVYFSVQLLFSFDRAVYNMFYDISQQS